jgi:hypothetical protein
MTRHPASKDSKIQSIKLVISAAAVATTLGGWVALTAGEAPLARVAGQPAPAAVAAAPPAWLLAPPPIPALPEVAALAVNGTGSPPQMLAAAPVAAAAPLRAVSAPPAPARPAPITVTRSSR